jgi:hypothetical protein
MASGAAISVERAGVSVASIDIERRIHWLPVVGIVKHRLNVVQQLQLEAVAGNLLTAM